MHEATAPGNAMPQSLAHQIKINQENTTQQPLQTSWTAHLGIHWLLSQLSPQPIPSVKNQIARPTNLWIEGHYRQAQWEEQYQPSERKERGKYDIEFFNW